MSFTYSISNGSNFPVAVRFLFRSADSLNGGWKFITSASSNKCSCAKTKVRFYPFRVFFVELKHTVWRMNFSKKKGKHSNPDLPTEFFFQWERKKEDAIILSECANEKVLPLWNISTWVGNFAELNRRRGEKPQEKWDVLTRGEVGHVPGRSTIRKSRTNTLTCVLCWHKYMCSHYHYYMSLGSLARCAISLLPLRLIERRDFLFCAFIFFCLSKTTERNETKWFLFLCFVCPIAEMGREWCLTVEKSAQVKRRFGLEMLEILKRLSKNYFRKMQHSQRLTWDKIGT